MTQGKVLSVGIRSTTNLGDLAISEMISKLLSNRGYQVEHLEFNFSEVVAPFFRGGFFLRVTDFFAGITTHGKNRLRERLAKVIGRIFKMIFYFPVVFLTFRRKARGCSTVFIGGGNLLMGIEHGFPLQVLAFVLFSRVLGKSVVFVCVGAGPFAAPGVKSILRLALRLSRLVICRDSKSKALIETELGGSLVAVDVLADPVLLWPKGVNKGELKHDVMFTFMPLFSPEIFPDGDRARAGNFKSCLVDLLVELINSGKRPGVLVTDSRVDLEISKTIVAEVSARTGVVLEIEIPTTPGRMAELVNSAGVVFSTRMHGAIMALSQSVPALCVGWQPKINGVYDDLALDNLVVELDDHGRFSIPAALETISEINHNRKFYVEGIAERLSEVELRYNRILSYL